MRKRFRTWLEEIRLKRRWMSSMNEFNKLIMEYYYALSHLDSLKRKLNNDKFILKAPQDVISKELGKVAAGVDKTKILQDEMVSLLLKVFVKKIY